MIALIIMHRTRAAASPACAPDEDDAVIVAHPEKRWHIRSVTLRSCSAVLDRQLRDDPAKPKVLNIKDATVESIDAFIHLATMLSHDSSGLLKPSEIAGMAAIVMPLVHKYDCKGLLMVLQNALNVHPHVDGILAVFEYAGDSSWEWIGDGAKRRLVRTLIVPDAKPAYMPGQNAGAQAMAKLPSNFIAELFSDGHFRGYFVVMGLNGKSELLRHFADRC